MARAFVSGLAVVVLGAYAAGATHVDLDVVCTAGQHYVFREYLPSDWETDWLKNGQAWRESICNHMVEQKNNSIYWMESLQALKDGPNYKALQTFSPAVWSRYVYVDVCALDESPDKHVTVYFEPVVGLMRHPLGMDECVYEGHSKVSTEEREYLTALGMTPRQFRAMYPGRAYFFDLGTGTNFRSSLEWFLGEYALHGVVFDQIYAWEIQAINQQDYWASMPAQYATKVHLLNMPVSSELHASGQAFQILRKIYRPGDFIALKLDIDHEGLEGQLVDKLLEDNQLQHMVGEMWFEQHHDAPEMQRSSEWGDTYAYHRALETFNKLRSKGLRMHMWP